MILDQYIEAIGGAQKVAAMTSFAAKGISQGFADDRVPFEQYGKAPNQHTLIVHGEGGDTTTTLLTERWAGSRDPPGSVPSRWST